MPISTTTANSLLNLAFKAVSYTPPETLYLSLLSPTGAELTTRVSLSDKMSSATGGTITNSADIKFPWDDAPKTVSALALFDQAEGGSAVDTITLTNGVSLAAFEAIRIPAGNITFTVSAPENTIYYNNQRIQDIDWRRVGPTHYSKHSFLRGVNCQRSVVEGLTNVATGGGGFFAAIVLQDGQVFCPPRASSYGALYNPQTNIVSQITGLGNGLLGGVLMQDGRVFCIPWSTTATIYDPQAAPENRISFVQNMGGTYIGGVLLPDGRVFCTPWDSATAAIYNPFTNQVETSVSFGASGAKYFGSVLLPDGRVFCTPYSPGQAAIYNPLTNQITYSVSIGTQYTGAVLLPDGKVFCVPRNRVNAAIYDPVNDTVTYSPNFASSGWYCGGTLLPDGRVFCTPRDATQAAIYDPVTNLVSYSGNFGSGAQKYESCTLMRDGRVFCTAFTAGTFAIYGSARGYTLPDARVLSAYDNKF